MMMKKGLSVLLAMLLALIFITGCNGKETVSSDTSSNPSTDKPSESKEAETITIAMGSVTAEDSPFQMYLLKFKEEVKKGSDGKINVEIFPNGELGGDRDMIEGVQMGTLDGVISSSAVLGNFSPMVNVMDFPFLYRDREHAYNVLDGEIGTEIANQVEEEGLKLLAWAENGFRNITNSKHPIKGPEDVKGLKIRTQENKIIVDSFTMLGVNPAPMSFTEVFSALQQGVVDGQENPLAILVSSKLYEVQKYLTISNHIYQPAPVTMNKDLFDSLSPELQKVVQDAAIVARDYEREYIASKDDEYLNTLIEKGMEVVRSEEFDRDAFMEISENVYKQYESEYGDFIQRIKDTK
ncbi:DctP family TRAP transporter solute-binding subunit [bacterium LRH843]|nr:DctP family TRAP transporter solute-binding subunit [bacterium LRH843]